MVVVNGAPRISTLDCWTCESRLWENQCYIMDADLEHKQLPGEHCPKPARYCHLGRSTVTPSSHAYSSLKSAASDGGEQEKTSEFHEHGSIAALHLWAVSSLIRSHAEWNTMVVDKAFCESTDGS